jgi:hypothetical protein
MPREHAGRDAVRVPVEAVGEHRREVGAPVAIAVADQPDPLAVLAVDRRLVAFVLQDHRDAIVDRPAGEVVLLPVEVVAQVEHLPIPPERLDDVAAPPRIDVERDEVRAVRLGGEELDLETVRHDDSRQPLRGLAVVGGNLGRVAGTGGNRLRAGRRRERKNRCDGEDRNADRRSTDRAHAGLSRSGNREA